MEQSIRRWAGMMAYCQRAGGTIYSFGNGGSYAQAEHLTAELVGRLSARLPDRRGIRAVTLPGGGATLTALTNDFGYVNGLVRALDGMVDFSRDCLVLYTTSASQNVIKMLEFALNERMGPRLVFVCGRTIPSPPLPGPGIDLRDIVTVLPARVPLAMPIDETTAITQELHLIYTHMVCYLFETMLHRIEGVIHEGLADR